MTTDQVQIWDNGGETADRYTAVFPDGDYIGMSAFPFHPQGIGMHGEGAPYWDGDDEPDECCLGKRIMFEDLPEQCQRAIKNDMKYYP